MRIYACVGTLTYREPAFKMIKFISTRQSYQSQETPQQCSKVNLLAVRMFILIPGSFWFVTWLKWQSQDSHINTNNLVLKSSPICHYNLWAICGLHYNVDLEGSIVFVARFTKGFKYAPRLKICIISLQNYFPLSGSISLIFSSFTCSCTYLGL